MPTNREPVAIISRPELTAGRSFFIEDIIAFQNIALYGLVNLFSSSGTRCHP
jgi:hypothetical protein